LVPTIFLCRRYDPYLIPDAASSNHGQLVASPDTTLTALAQLGALRLGATRSLISLFDHDTQYIAAEATPTLTLVPSATDDGIWACGTTVPRATSLCEHVLVASENDATEWHPEADLRVQVIPDLAADKRFHEAEQIHSKPFHRFYAGVAIRSPRGINIGVFCVFDTKPRLGLKEEEVQLFKELSASITSYLECRRSSERFRRSERMVRGIGDFVQSKATDPRRPSQGIAGLLRKGTAPRKRTSHTQLDAHEAVAAETAEDRSATSDTVAGNAPESREALLRSLFSRSADVIRESVEADGVTFLDASISTFAGLVPRAHSSEQSGTSSSEEDPLNRESSPAERHCGILGTSIAEPASSDGDTVLPGQAVVPDLALESLLRRYPRGVIFNFDDSGEVQSGDDSDGSSSSSTQSGQSDGSSAKPSRAAASRQKDAKMLLDLCPGARTVVLVPLWDLNKERWFAGGFVWTTAASRVSALEGDLSFLRAFGMTIMAEVGLIEATLSDRAKADVLGSLSHELRSPLHGVVAAVDLLHGTKLDGFQSDVVHTIETSGRTLLDTIDHLLDYSKVNSFAETSARERRKNKLNRDSPSGRGRRQSLATGLGSLTSDVQLDVIVEEVVEVVFAGHNFHHSINAADSLGNDSMAKADQLQLTTSPVSVYLDIDPAVPWGLRAPTGALRRIIMNLFGNALKYTDKGWISVSLRQQQQQQRASNGMPLRLASLVAVLTVADSGRGIGQDFLRNKLFVPFTQEDGLSSGSGLGLSLVHQIVTDLGGTIAVESELGRGTSVRVTLPLTPPSQTPQELAPEVIANVRELKGLRVFLSGFTEACDIAAPTRPGAKPRCSEMDLITSLCRGWLHLEVVATAEQADLVIRNDHNLQHLDSEALGAATKAPTVVICRNASVAHNHAAAHKAANGSSGYEFVSQPSVIHLQ
jgi:signal transduction histidine kinase/GAF domain-containing protein